MMEQLEQELAKQKGVSEDLQRLYLGAKKECERLRGEVKHYRQLAEDLQRRIDAVQQMLNGVERSHLT